ncbi:hypothetical protein IW967_01065 [Alicyclobacillus mali]|uniref:Transposase n=1 Tax=Alicyclobacillus mali (ex Roth et al. 2021) TaxID=1123961 RepID=A0ABS0EZL3_9BACL|nr:hypothetical protein [Alicyclobacillus mali (ex Roth et al. 2021)]MBF8376480.1 hypothetical protein [Alicyclobacillus mali (ex Roth et al. 2021)]
MTDLLRELEREFEEKGIQKVAQRLLEEGVSIDTIEKATGLSREQLEEMKKQLH